MRSGRLGRLGRAVVDFFFPEEVCAVCAGPLPPPSVWEPEACPDCLDDIFRRLEAAPAPVLSSPSAVHLDGVVTAGVYEGALRRAVLRLKDAPDRRLAGFLARLMAEQLGRVWRPAGRPTVVPVPLHPSRRVQRGFNQAELLAGELVRLAGFPAQVTACERVRDTPQQSGLDRWARSMSLIGAFRVRETAWVTGRTVLVVDDVVTTGATAGELARVLKAAGAREVWCAAAAGVHPSHTSES